jgi:hypothetical protein
MNRQIDSSGFEIGRHALTWAIAGVVATLAAVAIGVGGWVGVTILREQIAAGGIAISTNGGKRSPALAKIRTGRTRYGAAPITAPSMLRRARSGKLSSPSRVRFSPTRPQRSALHLVFARGYSGI